MPVFSANYFSFFVTDRKKTESSCGRGDVLAWRQIRPGLSFEGADDFLDGCDPVCVQPLLHLFGDCKEAARI